LVTNTSNFLGRERCTDNTSNKRGDGIPRDSLMANYYEQLKATFIGKPILEFKVRRFLLKNGEQRAHVLLIQTTPEKAKDVMHQFDEVAEMDPYEYISWKNWLDFHSSHKKVTIKAHNYYMVNHRLLYLQVFKDDSGLTMGKIKREKGQLDYSEKLSMSS
jgi:hypothetical protein